MFTNHELQEVKDQLIDCLHSDSLPITVENLDYAFEYTCNNGELCIDRRITEEEKQQFLKWYTKTA